MSLFAVFRRHPAAVGETYGEHFAFATGVGGRLLFAGLACMLHGLFPFLCERTGSRTIIELHGRVTSGARAAMTVAASEPSSATTNLARSA